MIHRSQINDAVKELIQKKLDVLSKTYNIRILMAIESGSRAWGFPSVDSDYDIRFIYVRHLDDYLSIKESRDVIETQLQHEPLLGAPEDLNGWDIRKALHLALKSNPVLFEWIQSPIQYVSDDAFDRVFFEFCNENANLDLIKNHYYKLALNAWKQIEEDTSEVKLKQYCYGLRPALMLNWLNMFQSIAPMDIYSLVSGSIKDAPLENAISELISAKETAQENQKMKRNSIIDLFISSQIASKPKDYAPIIINPGQLEKGNKLFRTLLNF